MSLGLDDHNFSTTFSRLDDPFDRLVSDKHGDLRMQCCGKCIHLKKKKTQHQKQQKHTTTKGRTQSYFGAER